MTKIDWKSEALAFLKLKASGEKVTAKRYVEGLSARSGKMASLPYFKKVLGKVRAKNAPRLRLANGKTAGAPPSSKAARTLMADPGWMDLREAYVTGRFRSLSDVARHLNLRPDHRGFREATAGWAKERKALQPAVSSKTADELAKSGAANAVRDIYAEALVIHYRILDMLLVASKAWEQWTDQFKSPWHLQMTAAAASDLAKAVGQILPAIKGLENLRAIHKIFDDLIENKTDITKASLDLARLGVALPKPIEILLAKHKAEEAPIDDGPMITDEEIMRRRAELLAEIQTERTEFVSERRRVVAQLKAETADSFRDQQEIETESKRPKFDA